MKGTAVQSSLRYVQERFGEDALARVVEALPEEDRAAFGPSFLASAWYPMSAFLRFMQEAERQLGDQEPDVFKVGSPEFIVSRGARVFSSYYDTGELRVVESSSGRAVVELHSFDGAPQFCERMLGWMQRTLELSGARNLRSSHTTCVHRGDAICRFEGSWD